MAFFDYHGDGAGDDQHAPFLESATDEDWHVLRAHTHLVTVPSGRVVMAEGAVDRALYILLSGRLAVTTHRRHGPDRLLRTLDAGTVIGEVAFFDGRPRSAAVRATEDATLLRLSYESFQALAAKEPALGRRLLMDVGRVLATRLRAVEHRDAGGRR